MNIWNTLMKWANCIIEQYKLKIALGPRDGETILTMHEIVEDSSKKTIQEFIEHDEQLKVEIALGPRDGETILTMHKIVPNADYSSVDADCSSNVSNTILPYLANIRELRESCSKESLPAPLVPTNQNGSF